MKKTFTNLMILILGILLLSSASSALPSTPDTPFNANMFTFFQNTKSTRVNDVREHRLQDFSNGLQTTEDAGIYHSYQEMTDLLHDLANNYSNIMSVTSLGKTFEDRDLWMVKLSDNVATDEDEPNVLFMGAHHGNEKPSYEVLIYFIQYMVKTYGNYSGGGDPSGDRVRAAINNTQIYIIPMVNPDGVEANTRKNCAPNHGSFGFNPEITSIGVDLNRNYGYRWMLLYLFPRLYLGSTHYKDKSSVYRGEYPFSEAETQAIRQFVETHDIIISITYHTYGELVLYPWGYTTREPKDIALFVSIGENISTIDNYTLAQSIDLYPTLGDACDWMYGKHGIIAYTIELGKNYAPSDPATLNQLCTLHTSVNVYICERADQV